MQIATPEGQLTIEDDELIFVPADNGEDVHVSLNPVPEFRFERGVYGAGTLVVGQYQISLNADQAPAVIEELRRPRDAKTARKSADGPKRVEKSDGDTVTTK